MVGTDLPSGHPRRICWLVKGDETYGVLRITAAMWADLRHRGIDVHAVSVLPGDMADSAGPAGVPITVLSAAPTGRVADRLRSVRVVRLLWDTVRTTRSLRHELRRNGADLLQLSDIELVPAARLATVGTRVRIVYLTPNRPPVHRIARLAFPRVLSGKRLTVLANSDDIRRRFHDTGVEATTLLLGLDPAEFALPEGAAPPRTQGPARFVTIGRVCTSKAQDLWMGAVLALVDRGHDLSLDVVGGEFFDPDFVAGLRRTADAAGHADRVRFTGPRTDIADLLAAADVAMCGTREVEAFGLSAVEALACERPVLVMGEGGIREIVDDGVTGWFVPHPDLESTVATLERCLADRERWPEMGAAGRRKVLDNYTVQRVVDRYLAIISS